VTRELVAGKSLVMDKVALTAQASLGTARDTSRSDLTSTVKATQAVCGPIAKDFEGHLHPGEQRDARDGCLERSKGTLP